MNNIIEALWIIFKMLGLFLTDLFMMFLLLLTIVGIIRNIFSDD